MQPTFKGELMLAGWSETHNGGAKVTFWLPDPTDLDAFKSLTIAKGKTAGHRFMAVLVEIGDDEMLKASTDAKIIGAAKGGAKARLAGILCADPAFQKWLFDRKGVVILSPTVDREASAAATVREVCRVRSRAELDHNEAAGKRFDAEIRLPWQEHCNAKA